MTAGPDTGIEPEEEKVVSCSGHQFRAPATRSPRALLLLVCYNIGFSETYPFGPARLWVG
jgi:hypothetical protein